MVKVFLAQKVLPTDLGSTRISVGAFRVLKFPLNFLQKTQISLRIFESLLARHAGCYCPIFEPSMLIFKVFFFGGGRGGGAGAVRYDCNPAVQFRFFRVGYVFSYAPLRIVNLVYNKTSSSKNRSDTGLSGPPRAIYYFIFFSLSWNIC